MKLRLSWILVAALAFISLSGCTLFRHRDHHGTKHKVVWIPGLGTHDFHKHAGSKTYHNCEHEGSCDHH